MDTTMDTTMRQFDGLTAVSKFKPRLPAQWDVGNHRNGPSRMDKLSSKMNLPIKLIDNTIMRSPSLFFISNKFLRTQNNFGPLNDDIITKFPWDVTMVPTAPSADILR